MLLMHVCSSFFNARKQVRRLAERPWKECKKIGCKELTRDASGFCAKHISETNSYDKYRPSANKRGYNSKWQKYRLRFIKKHPICNICHRNFATVVDHIIPHKGDTKLFWDHSNHQALCKQCHDRKTATEDGGFGNKRKYKTNG